MPDSKEKLSLDDFALLNDEIKAMVRAGVPLHAGLMNLAGENKGALNTTAQAIATSLEVGKSFPETIAEQPARFPRMYPALIEAGVRSGRLASALETVSDFAWELVAIRRQIGHAMLYPLLVVCCAYCLFVAFVSQMLFRILDVFSSFRLTVTPWAKFLGWLLSNLHIWVWIPPLVLLLLVLFWIAGRSATSLDFSGRFSMLRLIPGVSTMSRNYGRYAFCRVMSLLVKHKIPLSDGLKLAAGITGNRKLEAATAALVSDLDRGEDISLANKRYRAFPPFLQWIISRDQTDAQLPASLDSAAEIYRRRAKNYVHWLRFGFPVLSAVVIGGGVTLAYALTLFFPLTELLDSLSMEF